MIAESNKSDSKRIRELGHRGFVGGDGSLWEEIGRLQLDFMLSEGLSQNHCLVDIACGSLRAGRLFIDFLDAGNYFGIDKEIDLIIHGVVEELGISDFVKKRPTFVVSADFEFNKLPRAPDYAIAQSLLTHLTAEDIYRCFKSLRKFVTKDCKLYATFFEVQSSAKNPHFSDAIDCFFYTREEIKMLADLSGWQMQYIGDWGHPRHQMMVRLDPR